MLLHSLYSLYSSVIISMVDCFYYQHLWLQITRWLLEGIHYRDWRKVEQRGVTLFVALCQSYNAVTDVVIPKYFQRFYESISVQLSE